MALSVMEGDVGRSAVCESYEPLVLGTVRKLRVVPQLRDDAVQEGKAALLSAFDHYDQDSPVAFGVYAKKYVKGAIIRGVMSKQRSDNLTFVGDVFDLDLARERDRFGSREIVDLSDVEVEHMEVRAWRDSLSFGDQWIINRLFWDDATPAQIASELGRSTHWVNERKCIVLDRAKSVLKAG